MAEMTPEQERELRELCEKATLGPWRVENPDDDYCMNAFAVCTQDGTGELEDAAHNVAITLLSAPKYASTKEYEENANFIAAARTAVPALLDALDAARAEIAERRRHVATVMQREDAERKRAEAAEREVKKADECLVAMVEQYCRNYEWNTDQPHIYSHVFMYAGEITFEYLEGRGLAKYTDNGEDIELIYGPEAQS
jgi:hypothetical protein